MRKLIFILQKVQLKQFKITFINITNKCDTFLTTPEGNSEHT